MIAVWTAKTRRKRISLHLKNGSPTEATGVNSSAGKTCFITAINIFAHILRLIIQNRFHLLVKSTLAFEIH